MYLFEDEIICDLAETYNIYDYESFPLDKIAILVCGLKDNSRTKLKLNDQKINIDRLLLANAVDNLSFLVWAKTQDAKNGINPPKRFVQMLLGKEEEKELEGFTSGESFENAWNS